MKIDPADKSGEKDCIKKESFDDHHYLGCKKHGETLGWATGKQ